MSQLVLVRHGQAAAFQKESDVLTPVGLEQGRALARYWLSRRESFDEVFTGNLNRQRGTEALVAEAYRAARALWPEAQATAAWNEYDSAGVLARFVPALAGRDERFAALVREFENSRGTADQNRHFQRMFEVAMAQWMEAGVEVEGVEPFHAFEHRVETAVKTLLGRAGSRRVAVFTSGGPIGLVVRRVLNAPARAFLETHWRVRNASVTEFVYGSGRISLDSFNSVAHLDPSVITFR